MSASYVICPTHGRTQLSADDLRAGLAQRWTDPWVCPLCGADCEPDPESSYELQVSEDLPAVIRPVQ